MPRPTALPAAAPRAAAPATAALALLACAPAAAAQDRVSHEPARDAAACDGACDLTIAGGRPSLADRGTLFDWGGRAAPDAGGPDPDAPLVTDRPDFTEAASTVGRGVAQLEFGYTFTTDGNGNGDGGGRTDTHSFGEPLLRLGVAADWLELRVANTYGLERAGNAPGGPVDRTDGAEDLYLGLKIALAPQAGWLPETALIPQMTVPTGADAFTADTVLPGANLVYAWELSDRLATGGSTQVNRVVEGLAPVAVPGSGVNPAAPGDFAELAQSWTVAASLTDRVGAYGEYFGFYALSGGGDDEHYLNGGFTVLLTDDVQYDARVGVGLNEAADDLFAGTGLSIRFR